MEDVEHHVRARDEGVEGVGFDQEPRLCTNWDRLANRFLHQEERLEKRCVAQVALRGELVHETLEGRVLVLIGRQASGSHPLEQLPKARIPAQVRTQHERVGEEADQLLEFRPRTVRDRRGDDHVLQPRRSGEQRLVAREEGHEERGTLLLRERFHPADERPRQLAAHARSRVGLDRRSRVVGRQLEHRQVTAQLLAPVGELALEMSAFAFGEGTMPARKIRVLRRGLRQRRGFTAQEARVERHELRQEVRDRGTVEDAVMHEAEEYVLVRPEPREQRTEEWSLGQIEGLLRAGLEYPANLRPPALRILGPFRHQVFEANGVGFEQLDDRLSGARREDRPQHLVSARDLHQHALEHGFVQRPAQTPGDRDVVGGQIGLQLMQEPQPRLHEREGRRLSRLTLRIAIGAESRVDGLGRARRIEHGQDLGLAGHELGLQLVVQSTLGRADAQLSVLGPDPHLQGLQSCEELRDLHSENSSVSPALELAALEPPASLAKRSASTCSARASTRGSSNSARIGTCTP